MHEHRGKQRNITSEANGAKSTRLFERLSIKPHTVDTPTLPSPKPAGQSHGGSILGTETQMFILTLLYSCNKRFRPHHWWFHGARGNLGRSLLLRRRRTIPPFFLFFQSRLFNFGVRGARRSCGLSHGGGRVGVLGAARTGVLGGVHGAARTGVLGAAPASSWHLLQSPRHQCAIGC